LYTQDGEEVAIYKAYYVGENVKPKTVLQTPAGKLFDVDKNRFVYEHQEPQNPES
jgi:hypothetical protein